MSGGPRDPPTLVDTHCHLFLMEEDPADVLRSARNAGVAQVVCAAIDPESSREVVAMADRYPEVFATAGMHPHTASALDDAGKRAIEGLLDHPRVVAVGETGLDHFRMLSPREDQERAFRWQVRLAGEAGKPLVVHCREAWDDVLRVLDEEGAERVVLHCFTGDPAIARRCVERGYTLSFAANVTYPNADGIRAAARAVPEDRLVVETDSPFLPPQDRRGGRNTPAAARTVAELLAAERGASIEALSAALTANARRAFGLPAD